MDEPPLRQMIDFVQGEVRRRFQEAQTHADDFKAKMLDRFDGLEKRLVRIEQRMSAFEMRQPRFEADLRDVGRGLRELRERL